MKITGKCPLFLVAEILNFLSPQTITTKASVGFKFWGTVETGGRYSLANIQDLRTPPIEILIQKDLRIGVEQVVGTGSK